MDTGTPITFERFLTENEEKQLFKTVAAYGHILARRDLHWMRLLRHTGIRIGTLAGLTVQDTRNAISNKRLVLRDEICKGGRGYTLPLNKHAVAALRGLIKIRTEQGHALINDDPLIMSRKHNALAIRSFQQRMAMWVKKADLQIPATPHYFRHTMGRRVIDRSTSPNPQRIAQSVLNHSNIATTSIYTQPSREDLERAMDEIA